MQDCGRVFRTWATLTAWLYETLPAEQAEQLIQQAEQVTDVHDRFVEFTHNDIRYHARITRL